MWSCSSCNGMADNTSLFVEYFGWIGLYVWREALEQGDCQMSGYFDGRNGRLSKTWRFRRSGKSVKTLGDSRDSEIFSLRRSAGTRIIAVLPGNHEEFQR